MTASQSACFVELSGFDDMARFACAFREYPRRVYSQQYDGDRVLSSSVMLANTLLVFYSPMPKDGRYISYNASSGNELCDVVDSTKDISHYAPIVHVESDFTSLPPNPDSADKFHPVQVRDLGSLARLTYDPEFPDEQDLTLYSLPCGQSWAVGYVTSIDMDQTYYNFNYVQLDSEPERHFLKYQGNRGQDPVFSDTFDHGFSYLPIIRIKEQHPIFGF